MCTHLHAHTFIHTPKIVFGFDMGHFCSRACEVCLLVVHPSIELPVSALHRYHTDFHPGNVLYDAKVDTLTIIVAELSGGSKWKRDMLSSRSLESVR